jgi:cytochrome c oxidase subunit 2
MCHTIGGTNARATVGPNLTHVMGRQMIGAGTLPTTKGHLGGWISDPQQFKPGIRMPPNPLQGEDFRALLDYLETLK